MQAITKIIGVYKIKPTIESISQAARYHEYDDFIDSEGNYSEAIYWKDFKNLCLFEIQISGEFTAKLLYDISQKDPRVKAWNEQVPYLEFFLNESGDSLLTEEEAFSVENRRICFFLHFTNKRLPLTVGQTNLKLPKFTPLPQRLIGFTHYSPPD